MEWSVHTCIAHLRNAHGVYFYPMRLRCCDPEFNPLYHPSHYWLPHESRACLKLYKTELVLYTRVGALHPLTSIKGGNICVFPLDRQACTGILEIWIFSKAPSLECTKRLHIHSQVPWTSLWVGLCSVEWVTPINGARPFLFLDFSLFCFCYNDFFFPLGVVVILIPLDEIDLDLGTDRITMV